LNLYWKIDLSIDAIPGLCVKTRIAQRLLLLLLRGSRDFADLDDYRGWLAGLMAEANAGKAAALALERAHLRPLACGRLSASIRAC